LAKTSQFQKDELSCNQVFGIFVLTYRSEKKIGAWASVIFSKTELESFYRYCVVLVRNKDLAYDLLQTTLEKWVRGRFHERVSHPRAYFMRMIKSQFVDDLRKEKDAETVAFDEETLIPQIGGSSLEDILVTKEEVKRILSFITLEEREILFLWAVEGYTVQEIADFSDKPKGTILAKLFRVRSKIKDRLKNTKKGSNS